MGFTGKWFKIQIFCIFTNDAVITDYKGNTQ